jgi:hypothetical protein
MSIDGFAGIEISKILPILWKQYIAYARIFPVFSAADVALRAWALLAAKGGSRRP